MIILLLKGYNNYFNRIIKKEASITAYKEASTSYLEYGSVNFNPNDGITASLVVGGDTQKIVTGSIEKILDFEKAGSPDYLIAYENGTGLTQNIHSRWFIVECVRVMAGQYQLTLKRDVITDYYDDIKEAPVYIEKATITDFQNPLLYNSEGFAVNQIKTQEYLLKDRSGVAWVVGYVSSKLASESKNIEIASVALNSSGVATGSFVYTTSTSFVKIYIQYNGQNIYGNETGFSYTFTPGVGVITYNINVPAWANQTASMRVIYTEAPTIVSTNYKTSIPSDESRLHLEDAPYDMFCIPFGSMLLRTANVNTVKEAALEIALECAKDIGTQALYDIQLLPYCPRLDMVVNGDIAEVLGTNGIDYNYILDSNNAVKSIILWCNKSSFSGSALPENDIIINRDVNNTVKSGEITVTDGTLTRLTGADSGYVKARIENNALKGFYSIESITGVEVHESITGYNASTTTTRNVVYNPANGVLIFEYYDGGDARFASGQLANVNIKATYTYKTYKYPEYLDYKISNECDLYRLVSPNFNGQFEWSLAKSSGAANIFDIDCTYKPYQPYIHVQPIFSNFYGSDFNDCRGLLCGGDFSLPIISDAWTEYQVQNKNYQESFDRQIQNFDVHRVVDSQQSMLNWAAGLGNIGLGTLSNMMHSKNSYQMAGAAGIGMGRMGLSIATGIEGLNLANQAYDEDRQFAIDQFNYSLQNIQALPYSLMKVNAYTANNKIFPMVEYYTCKEVEKQALRDKIKYNGMTVMVIGKIKDYVSAEEKRYIKGQLIRLEVADDSHIVNDIYSELNKGVYI